MSFLNSPNNDKTILESEIIELNNFLNGLLHDIDLKAAQLEEAALSPRSNNKTSQEISLALSSRSKIKYTTSEDCADADITNVVAYEEIKASQDVSDVSYGNANVKSDKSVIDNVASKLSLQLETFNSSNLFSPTEPEFGCSNLTSTMSLDTISSIDTISRPSISIKSVPNVEPFTKYNGAPFHLFNVSHLKATTTFNMTLGKRSVAYYGDYDYSYSGITHKAKDFGDNKYLLHILSYVQIVLPEYKFNSAMIHGYADGTYCIPHHSDNEDCIVYDSDIITISLGESREMEFRNKNNKETTTVELIHGEVLVMSKVSQETFTHAINPELGKQTRMSITLRLMKTPSETNVIQNSAESHLFDDLPSVISNIDDTSVPDQNVTLPQPGHGINDSMSTVTEFLNDLNTQSPENRVPDWNPNSETQQHRRVRPDCEEVDGYQDFTSLMNQRNWWENAPPPIMQPEPAPPPRLTRETFRPRQKPPNLNHPAHELLNQQNSRYSWHRQGYQPRRSTVQHNTQFPPEQLHPSRHKMPNRNSSFRPFQPQIQNDVVFISSSMFADLNASKLSTSDINAHVFFYRGADSFRMLEKLKQDEGIQSLSKKKSVKKVFLLTGTNNVDQICARKQSMSNGCNSIDQMIRYVQYLFPNAVISTLNILPRCSQDRQNVIDQLNRHIKQVCENEVYGLLNFIDTYEMRLLTLPSGTRKSELFKYTHRNDTDNVHLNNYGIAKLGGVLKYLAHQ